ncbi:MAG: magnesium transporter [Candidatus Uhrbacteria bacterium]
MPTSQQYIDDETREHVGHLVRKRVPWLLLGLLGGICTSLVVSRFETILSGDVRIAFFIPIIVYMSGAISAQTGAIYVRHLRHAASSQFIRSITKEIGLGISLGILFGFIVGIFAYFWLGSMSVGITIGISMFCTVALAPMIATIVTAALYRMHSDPALGSGPITTIIQDFLSLLIYLLIASSIILN